MLKSLSCRMPAITIAVFVESFHQSVSWCARILLSLIWHKQCPLLSQWARGSVSDILSIGLVSILVKKVSGRTEEAEDQM